MFVTERLPHYLRTHRKRRHLTQREVAILLPETSVSAISRCERFEQLPSLETALAYEVLFGVSVRDLFVGTAQQVELQTKRRAQELFTILRSMHGTTFSTQKRQALERVVAENETRPPIHHYDERK